MDREWIDSVCDDMRNEFCGVNVDKVEHGGWGTVVMIGPGYRVSTAGDDG